MAMAAARLTEMLDTKGLSEELTLLRELDSHTSRMLGLDGAAQTPTELCCGKREVAQFLYFFQSRACRTNVCAVPGKDAGWDIDKFLQLYIRSLNETIERVARGQDNSFSAVEKTLLLKELQIALACYKSAMEGKKLEEAHFEVANAWRDWKSVDKPYRDAKARNTQDKKAVANARKELILCTDERDSILRKIQKLEAGAITSKVRSRLNELDTQLEINLKRFFILQRNYQIAQFNEKASAVQVRNTEPNSMRKFGDFHRARARYNAVCDEYSHNLMRTIDNLPLHQKGSHDYHCQAIGTREHAMYAGVRNCQDRVEVKIFNLGIGNDFHTNPKNSTEILPVVLRFKKDEKGRKQLKDFCDRVARAFTEREETGLPLIYRDIPNSKAALQRYARMLHSKGLLTAEIEQSTSNCTGKNFLHSVEDRAIENPGFFEKLYLSLFTWCQNSYALREYADGQRMRPPASFHEILPDRDLENITRSQAPFKNSSPQALRDRIRAAIKVPFQSSLVSAFGSLSLVEPAESREFRPSTTWDFSSKMTPSIHPGVGVAVGKRNMSFGM